MDGNNVEYTYHPGGRIESITDGTGHRKLGYDALGNLVFNRHTYVQPHSPNTLTLTTQWHYDSWGRMLQMTYSDGESVHYEYNRAGDLLRMYGEKNNHSRKYIDNIGYNKYGQRTRIDYGNGSYTEYAYDPLRRLTSLHSVDGTVSHRTMQLNEYTFDKLNNIVQVHNAASDIGGLGGVYTNTYSYDELNRLVEAHGTGTAGRQLCEFQMGGMRYSASGRLGLKHQNWNSATTGGTQRLEYGYPGNAPDDKPHAPRLVEDIDAGRIYGLEWDPAGNLIQVSVQGDDPAFQSRFLYWTEDNRLHTVADDYSYSYYAYGHTGQRTLKMAGNASLIDQNAWHQSVFVGLDRVTMYPSAYLVLSEHGYTKHYYAGAERVAARIGGGNLNHDTECIVEDGEVIERSNNLFRQCSDIVNNYTVEHRDLEEMNIVNIDNDEMEAMWKFDMKQVPSMMKAEVIPEPWKILDAIEHFSQPNSIVSQGDDDEPDVYFYHSDHLGSASWITDGDGIPVQHLQYLPYGEPYINQRVSGYSERFTFTGKERDEETGYGYFGARYMDHELMTMWLSVDPLADKYPSISPYAYCAWNPIIFVDPDGMKFDSISQIEVNKLKQQVALNILKRDFISSIYRSEYNNTLNEISDLENSDQMYSIQRRSGDFPVDGINAAGYTYYNVTSNVVSVIYNGDLGTLAHELKHAFQFETGSLSFTSSGKSGGLLHDFFDEREAYTRGAALGRPAVSDESIQTQYNLPMTNTTVNAKRSSGTSIIPTLGDRGEIYRVDGVTYKGRDRILK